MIHPAIHDAAGPDSIPCDRSGKPRGGVGSPSPGSLHPRHDGARPPLAEWKPCLPNLSRTELRRIVIDILG